MSSHIFLVTQDRFPTCLEYGVYGGISHSFFDHSDPDWEWIRERIRTYNV